VHRRIAAYILDLPAEDEGPVTELVKAKPGVDALQRLGIYHNAYRARVPKVIHHDDPKTKVVWLQTWLSEGLLRAD